MSSAMRPYFFVAAGVAGVSLGIWLDALRGGLTFFDWGPWYVYLLEIASGAAIGEGAARIVIRRRREKLRRDTARLEERVEEEIETLNRIMLKLDGMPALQAQAIIEEQVARVLVDLMEEGLVERRDIDRVFEQRLNMARTAERN